MRLKTTTFALLLAALAGPAAAQVAPYDLRVNPYPVPYPFYDSQSSEHSIFSMSYVRTSIAQNNAPNLALNGGAVGVTYRRAIDDQLAWDAQFSIVPLVGSVSDPATGHTQTMSFVGVPLTTDVEYQAWKNQTFNVIVFGGPHFNIVSSNFEDYGPGNYNTTGFNPTGTGTNTYGTTTLLYGLQFGAQLGVETGFVKLAPFVELTPEWGTYTTKAYSPVQNDTVSTSNSLPTSFMTSVGVQAFFGPGFGVSAVYQTVPSYSANNTTYESFRNLLVNVNIAF